MILYHNKPRRNENCLRGFRPGLTQTDLYSLRSRLETLNCEFKKDYILCVAAENKGAIVFAWAKIRFSHDAGHILYYIG